MKYDEEHRSWSTCREYRLFAVFERYSLLPKHPSRKECSFSDLCIFCLLSSTKSVLMYLLTCWKYKYKSHIFISPCRNDQPQLQNCRTKRFFTVFLTLHVTWRQRKEILPPPPEESNVLCLFGKFERFIRFDTWGTAPPQRLCQNMVRTWYICLYVAIFYTECVSSIFLFEFCSFYFRIQIEKVLVWHQVQYVTHSLKYFYIDICSKHVWSITLLRKIKVPVPSVGAAVTEGSNPSSVRLFPGEAGATPPSGRECDERLSVPSADMGSPPLVGLLVTLACVAAGGAVVITVGAGGGKRDVVATAGDWTLTTVGGMLDGCRTWCGTTVLLVANDGMLTRPGDSACSGAGSRLHCVWYSKH